MRAAPSYILLAAFLLHPLSLTVWPRTFFSDDHEKLWGPWSIVFIPRGTPCPWLLLLTFRFFFGRPPLKDRPCAPYLSTRCSLAFPRMTPDSVVVAQLCASSPQIASGTYSCSSPETPSSFFLETGGGGDFPGGGGCASPPSLAPLAPAWSQSGSALRANDIPVLRRLEHNSNGGGGSGSGGGGGNEQKSTNTRAGGALGAVNKGDPSSTPSSSYAPAAVAAAAGGVSPRDSKGGKSGQDRSRRYHRRQVPILLIRDGLRPTCRTFEAFAFRTEEEEEAETAGRHLSRLLLRGVSGFCGRKLRHLAASSHESHPTQSNSREQASAVRLTFLTLFRANSGRSSYQSKLVVNEFIMETWGCDTIIPPPSDGHRGDVFSSPRGDRKN